MSRADASPVWVSRRAQYEAPGSEHLIFHWWGAPDLTVCGMSLTGLLSIRSDWAVALSAQVCRNCLAIESRNDGEGDRA